jgi:GT2 family glycosyltransferase
MSLLRENISFVVVCYKSSLALKSLLLSIPKESEVILVDNSKDQETKEIAISYDCVLIENKENIGYGSACNLGAEKASGSYLLFINPDSELNPETLDELIKATDRYPNASAFNPKIIDRTGKQDFKRRSVLLPKSEWMSKKFPTFDKDVSVLSGAAIFIKKEKFLQIKGFDEKIFLYHEDDDISIRLKNKIGNLMYIHNAVITHIGGSSSSRDESIAKIKGYHMGRSRVYAQKKHNIKAVIIRNIMLSIIQVLSPEMLFSKRKRAKYTYFLKGVFAELNFRELF